MPARRKKPGRTGEIPAPARNTATAVQDTALVEACPPQAATSIRISAPIDSTSSGRVMSSDGVIRRAPQEPEAV